jgi:dTDP-4-amino-4,6-dideoxygalactose transaminase
VNSGNQIAFFDPTFQHTPIQEEIAQAFERIALSGRFIRGEEVEAFEQDFARYCGVEHAIAVNSGTSALHLALLAAGIGPGDEVITTAMTFLATAAAIIYAGARPVLVDVDQATNCMDPGKLEAVISKRTKAILPVHLYGYVAEMDAINEIASRHGLLVIEDAAQAHGAVYHGKCAGALGQLAAFSFYPSKNLGAFGEGGAVVTNDGALAKKIRMLGDWGQFEKGRHLALGYNYRMDALQGAVLRIKLRHLDAWIAARNALAAQYAEALANMPLTTPYGTDDPRHALYIFAVRHEKRDQLRAALARKGIDTGIHYPQPVHLIPAFADLDYREGDFPNAEKLALEELSLPLYPGLPLESVARVATAIEEFFQS